MKGTLSQKAIMAKNQNTMEKRRREMEKKRKAEEKRERRKKRKEEGDLDVVDVIDTPEALSGDDE